MGELQAAQLELIVRKVISGELLQNWNFYLVLLALVIVGGAGVSFVTAYLESRAKNYATKADFQELLAQLKQNTEATEKIKAEVLHEDWKLRERRVLRRGKLEELMYAVHASSFWLDRRRAWWFSDTDIAETEPDPGEKVATIGGLYFPELRSLAPYQQARTAFNKMIVDHKTKLRTAKTSGTTADFSAAVEAAVAAYKEKYPQYFDATNALSKECSNLMAAELG
ncbi:MAG: hypothetical protein EON54_05830 [Alcaligenaceae bacterium]|nr:MAG: hypothetical protein EON54_05830 [Alcaligenaceae bacterium]